MRKLALLLSLFATTALFAQEGTRKIPGVDVKLLDGTTFNTSDISNEGKPVVISFWATWCSPCKRELNTIAELYDDWQEETGVKLIAVSIDDTRSASRVLPYINASGWEYDVYLDSNHDFKRAMNVNNVPHTFLIDGEGNIVWQHNNYADGDEEELYEHIVALAKK